MTIEGIDCYSPISSNTATCMKNNGISFAGRYYCPLGKDKLLTRAEAEDILNAGLQIFVVYEWGATEESHFTYDNGYNDCLDAISRAHALGQPYNSAIYFAVDYDMRNNLTAVYNYFHGVADAMNEFYRLEGNKWYIGVYGGYDVVEYIDNKWGVSYIWQTKSWSEGRIYSGNNIYQYDTQYPGYNIYVCSQSVDKNSSSGSTGGFSTLI